MPLSVLSEAWPFGSSLFEPVRPISKYQIGTVKATETVPRLQQSVLIQGKQFMFEVDTGTGDNFCSEDVWCDLEKPPLSPATGRYEVENGQPLPTLGIFSAVVTAKSSGIHFHQCTTTHATFWDVMP